MPVQPGYVEHIIYAQCALLDETVLSRGGMDDGQAIWMKDPLQSHFFNTRRQASCCTNG